MQRSQPTSPAVPLLPLAAPASPASPARARRSRARARALAAGLLAFLLANLAFIGVRSLVRSWREPSTGGPEELELPAAAAAQRQEQEKAPAGWARQKAASAADSAATAALDAGGVLKRAGAAAAYGAKAAAHGAQAAVQGAQAAGAAAGAALAAAAPVATKAAAAAGGAAKEAVEAMGDVVKGAAASLATSNTSQQQAQQQGEAQQQDKQEEAPVHGTAYADGSRSLAELTPPEVSPASSDACAQARRRLGSVGSVGLGGGSSHGITALGMPKVALLFLTIGDLYHEAAWRLWFASAGGLLPARDAQATVCNASAEQFGKIQAACDAQQGAVAHQTATPAADPIAHQHLFSIYVHAPPFFEGYPSGSLWQGRLIPRRVSTGWGSMSLVEATRNLLWEAFRDPLNQRFVLVSESDIPLYDPFTLHQQLLSEDKSRLNACKHASRHEWRWSKEMETEHMRQEQWRKSSQWVGLKREHVEAALLDQEVYRSFEVHCWSNWSNTVPGAWRDCFPDEHYFPTLLAVLGREAETECAGWGVAAQDWSKGGAHPRSFKPAEVSPALLRGMQAYDSTVCNGEAAAADAQHMYVDKAALTRADQARACGQLRAAAGAAAYAHPMPGACPLTARKFPAPTAPAVLRLVARSCGGTGGVRLLAERWCRQQLLPGVTA
ncbi:beta-1,6-N-acetylglucosaminyltransferase enzyme [Micractinium conductrix]|uniref:Beta-1,6-N-acetylglucosaminyltransferase enzyme n=1 Tax=Micractinium conductrix TaxID=554055 RepID=A0A2P6UZC2_9CHLO|nr:beta-1,6-N-acetylglucosaminyltransferase enzyme [Micractinium conductrix]|eukprot:PSC67186.1 beta-1,6-N-acetylglucosaminyltransferase enzyme [Micractinium conductrix]